MVKLLLRKFLSLKVLISLMFFVVSIFLGVAICVGGWKFSILLIGFVSALFLLLLKNNSMIEILAVTVTLIIGQLMYFLGLNQALWLPYGLGLLLYCRLPSLYLEWKRNTSVKKIPFVGWLLILAFAVSFSSLINLSDGMQVLVGSKNLIALWSVYLIIALGGMDIHRLERLWGWLIVLAYLQLPFVFYQYFIIAAGRSNQGGNHGVSWDAIVGTFGGDPNSGGASGVMAFALVAACLLAFSFWRKKLIKTVVFSLIMFVSAICVGLAEVKVVVILLPIGIAIICIPDLIKRPFVSILSIVAVIGLMIGLLYVYNDIHYASAGQQTNNFSDLLDKSFGYSLDPNYLNPETGEISRIASLILWWQDGMLTNPIRGIFGYGPGASRSLSSFAVGEVASRYPFFIDRSAACQLLWDIGLLGLFTMIGILSAGAISAYRLAKIYAYEPRRQAILEASSAILVLTVSMLPYSRDLLEIPAQGFFMVFILGYVAYVSSYKNTPLTKSNIRCLS